MTHYGFIGLGDMGAPMAANIAAAGLSLSVYDKAGTEERAPERALACASISTLCETAEIMFLSVPDAAASLSVAMEIAAQPGQCRAVINTSTVGLEIVPQLVETLGDITYVDAPVSGGRAGAVKGSITLMWGGDRSLFDAQQSVLSAFTGKAVFVGEVPGQGQAMKLLNNYLSAVAMAATSEAVSFGTSQGLEMDVMLDVLNASTGRNSATADKFPNRVATGSFDAGFRMALMAKDVALFHAALTNAGTSGALADVVNAQWQDYWDTLPDADFTEVFKLVDAKRPE